MGIERARHCGLYLPGHEVHRIQAIRGAKERSLRPDTQGHLLEVRPDGLVIVEVDGGIRRLWNHDPDRLEHLVARNRGKISHQPSFGLLRTASEGGSYVFCVADADSPDLRPCPTRPPGGNPMDLLLNAGGFSIPGPEALRWAESLREEEGDE